jgi:hypothetical protein
VLASLAACTSGSGGKSGTPTPSPVVSSAAPTLSPVIDPAQQGVDQLDGTATITLSTQSKPVTVTTSSDSPSQLSVDTAGHYRVEVTMHGPGGALFSLAGPASVGDVTTDHVSVFEPTTGLLVDTEQGNVCTVRYTRVSETGVAGAARCDAETGAQRFTVTVAFTLR